MECSGNENALRDAIPFLRKLGEAFQIGVPWHKCSDWDAHSLLYELFYSFISIHGGWEWSIPRKDDDTHVHSSYGHIRTAMQLIADGKITVPKRLYELRDPRECDAVYHELSGSQDGVASVILDWRRFVTG